MTPNGELLRLARNLRGMTQSQVAKALELPQAAYSRIENGLVSLDSDILSRAAQHLDLPELYFTQNQTVYGPPVSVHPMMRKASRVSAREVDMITAELNFRAMHLRRFAENIDVQSTIELPKFDIDSFESAPRVADLLRRYWKLP